MKTNWVREIRKLVVGKEVCGLHDKKYLSAASPLAWGMLVHREILSTVTSKVSDGSVFPLLGNLSTKAEMLRVGEL